MVIQNGYYKFKGVYHAERIPTEDEYKEGKCAQVYVKLDDTIVLFEEDPSDGYRSYCGEEVVKPSALPENAHFNLESYPVPCYVKNIAERLDKHGYDRMFRGIGIYTDDSCEIELAKFGTDNADDYYPGCVQWLDIPAINKHISEHHLLGD